MEHIHDYLNPAAAQPRRSAPADRALTRRSFIRFFGVGVAALAVEGCGGGGESAAPALGASPGNSGQGASNPNLTPSVPASAPAPASDPVPVWLPIPALVFTQGVPASISIANYVSAANAKAFNLSLNATPLPSGVTFNRATLAFDYDGRGTMATSDGHVLTAAAT